MTSKFVVLCRNPLAPAGAEIFARSFPRVAQRSKPRCSTRGYRRKPPSGVPRKGTLWLAGGGRGAGGDQVNVITSTASRTHTCIYATMTGVSRTPPKANAPMNISMNIPWLAGLLMKRS